MCPIDNKPALVQANTWTNADPVHWRIYAVRGGDELTHRGQVTCICASILVHHWSRQRFVACSGPSHYLNQSFLVWSLDTNSSVTLQQFPYSKINLKMSWSKWPLFFFSDDIFECTDPADKGLCLRVCLLHRLRVCSYCRDGSLAAGDAPIVFRILAQLHHHELKQGLQGISSSMVKSPRSSECQLCRHWRHWRLCDNLRCCH